MKKRVISIILCAFMLFGMTSITVSAEDTVKAGEKAITVRQTSIYEEMGASKSSGVVSKGTVVDVLEAFVVSPKNNIKYHKIQYTDKSGDTKTVYIQALLLGSIPTLGPYNGEDVTDPSMIEECYYVDIKIKEPAENALPVHIV